MADNCSRCGERLKVGMVSSNVAMSKVQIAALNLTIAEQIEHGCSRCCGEQFGQAKHGIKTESQLLENKLCSILSLVPLLSLNQPLGWEYEPITMVTAQTVTGTGIFSDIASAFTDFFGTQSGTYNAKIRDGENLCANSLRSQTLELGGNAVLAVDIDYAEVGGQRAMLMVCMTGTAVRVSKAANGGIDLDATKDGASTIARLKLLKSTIAAALVNP